MTLDGEAALAARADRLLLECRRWHLSLAVLRVHTDDAAESLMVDVLGRLRSRLRARDAVYRLGPGEAAALVADASPEALAALAERVRATLAGPYTLDDGTVIRAAPRVGVALSGAGLDSGSALVAESKRTLS